MSQPRNLALYRTLSRLGLLKNSYIGKIMLVAFLGTHIPLLALILSFVVSNSYSWDTAIPVLVTALLATLVGTAATLLSLQRLLIPVSLTSSALTQYIQNNRLVDLPTQFTDEAGRLMADTTYTLHKLDDLIHYIRNYNSITGLPNRDHLCRQIMQKSRAADGKQQTVIALLIGIQDLDGASSLLSRQTYELLLRGIANRLSNCADSEDLIAHLDKDEFLIASSNFYSFEYVIKQAQLVLSSLRKSFCLNGQSVHITPNVGIAVQQVDDASSVDELLRKANVTLHKIKSQGQGAYQFYSPDINADLQEKLLLENALHGAIERNELEVYYQPLVDLDRQCITAVEALVRWQHPTLGSISPGKFIPIAEANGLIVDIGEWVLRTACAQNRTWQDAGLPPIRVSVNLAAQQFNQPNLIETVAEILESTQLDPAWLELEVTESSLMSNVENSVQTLHKLRHLGLCLALDDFGTGYSSLNYLQRFPVHMLKIDRSFVQDVSTNIDSATITNAIIALAKSLGLGITAEGVENKAHLGYLKAQGCHEVQGFYFARPAPADAITPMLKAGVASLFEGELQSAETLAADTTQSAVLS